MEANDLAGISYASQMLAFAVLSVLFLVRRNGSPFSRYLAVASAASSLLGGVLALNALGIIAFNTVIVLAVLVTYSSTKFESLALSLLVSGGVLMAAILVIILEQIYRNLPSDSASSLKYICVALLVVAAYDIVLFLRTFSVDVIEVDLWRGTRIR